MRVREMNNGGCHEQHSKSIEAGEGVVYVTGNREINLETQRNTRLQKALYAILKILDLTC